MVCEDMGVGFAGEQDIVPISPDTAQKRQMALPKCWGEGELGWGEQAGGPSKHPLKTFSSEAPSLQREVKT